MNRTALTLSTTFALSLISGAAVAGTSAFPDCIASPHELSLNEIAERMFMQLPKDQQKTIALGDGIGSHGFDLEAFERGEQIEIPEHVKADITAHEYLELLVSEELGSRLSEEQWNILNAIADSLDDGKIVPALCFAPGTDPEYAYAINQLIEFPFQIMFQQTGRWNRTATNGSGLQQGDPTTLTYSYVPDGTFIPNTGLGLGSGNSVLFAWLNSRYGPPSVWQPLFDQVFDRWAELTGLSYVYEPNDDGANTNTALGVLGVRGDIRIGAFNFANDGNFGVLAYNNFPQDGDMIFDAYDSYYNSTSNNYRSFRNVASHEHGHGLGMLHVCPITNSKLMEPFATNSFDGPQLDDILNGHRHYGDPTEPNNSPAQAIDMGSLDATDFYGLSNLSIDDNSEFDMFRFELTERANFRFVLGPQADEYRSGPQTQFCNNGVLVDYDAIQDLKIDLYEEGNLIIPIASEDSTGAGENEDLQIALEDPGVYYLIISASSNINNVQRYEVTALTTELPPVKCPADLTGDGILDFFDVSAFLSAFNNMDSDADFNNDGMFDFFDVSAFLNEYNAGCP
ncbi:MAG: GC-type dockerin domain-anchored protein [Phycisphaerales bacterium]